MGLNSRHAYSVKSRVAFHQQLLRRLKSSAVLLSSVWCFIVEEIQGSLDAALCSPPPPPPVLPHLLFLWHFLSKVVRLCASASTHALCSPPNFHGWSPPTHNFTPSCTPRIRAAQTLLAFSWHVLEGKKLTSSKKAMKFMSRTSWFWECFLFWGLLSLVSCLFYSKDIWSLALLLGHLPTPVIFPYWLVFPSEVLNYESIN